MKKGSETQVFFSLSLLQYTTCADSIGREDVCRANDSKGKRSQGEIEISHVFFVGWSGGVKDLITRTRFSILLKIGSSHH